MDKDIVEQNNEIISVGELNRCAKYLLESNFPAVSVIGEISNLARPASGHIYFSLKDDEGSIQCAMFKGSNMGLNFNPKDGDECIVSGNISLFVQRGNYQLIAKKMILAGQGNLMQEFEKLKSKLKDEGLFDDANKLPIPEAPKHVAVITSTSTAALQDILSTIERRAPSMKISVSPATVQGENASETIIEAFKRIQNYNNKSSNKIDCVLLCRGGGSIEDLWCFNNEELAREIFSFPIPTISGVGHEIDFTICDFVSDMRVPTPTASAELVTEFNFNLRDKILKYRENLRKNIHNYLENLNQVVNLNKSKLKDPLTMLREKSQHLDNLDLRIRQQKKLLISNNKNKLERLSDNLNNNNPISKLNLIHDKVNSLFDSLNRGISQKIQFNNNLLAKLYKNIEILNPLSILDRGYAIVMNKKGEAIKSTKKVAKGERLKARLSDGLMDIEVLNND